MRHPITPGPSQADADALVLLPKYLRRMPPQRDLGGCRRIKTDRILDSAGNPTGLLVVAHKTGDGRTHGETVQVALVWRREAIRCIDWKAQRVFADGTVVHGWHEHTWDDEHGRNVGRHFAPPIGSHDDLEALFIAACQHWNIRILTRQDQRLRSDGNADC